MGIPLASSFDLTAALPLDSRFYAATDIVRDAIDPGVRYEGLLVYVAATKKLWQLQGGITNSDWVEAGGGSSGILVVTSIANRNAIASGDRYDGLLVYVTADKNTYQLKGGILDANWDLLVPAQAYKNYLGTVNGINGNGNFELGNTTKWNLFSTTMTGKIPTGTIAAPGGTIDSFTAISSNVLAGTYSGQINASAAISPGDGVISDAFTLDAEDVAKPFSASFYYQALGLATPGTSSNSFAVYLYDVANSAWVQPSNVYGINQSTNIGKWSGEFQTSSNATTYQIALICITVTSGLPVELRVDDFSVGPSIYNNGTPVTDWQAYTPTFTGFGSTTLNFAKYRRVGSNLEIDVRFASGTGTAVEARLSFPPGLTASSDLPTLSVAGAPWATDQIDTNIGVTVPLKEPSVSYFTFGRTVQTVNEARLVKKLGNNLIAPVTISVQATVPILGWSSSVQMSDSADTRVVASYASGSTAVGANTRIPFTTTKFDTHGVYNVNGSYTVAVPGYYKVSVGLYSGNATTNHSIYINGSLVQLLFVANTGGHGQGSSLINTALKAGDVIDIRGNNNIIANVSSYFAVEKVSGPSAIAASELIAASYWATAATAGSTSAPWNFDAKEYDTHGCVTTGSGWRFTSPANRIYDINVYANPSGSVSFRCYIYKGGTSYKAFSNEITGSIVAGATKIRLLAGEYIDIRPQNAITLNGNASLALSGANIAITSCGL